MVDPSRDRGQLARFFNGIFGEYDELYGNMVVAGQLLEEGGFQAVLGWYRDKPRLRFYRVESGEVTAEWLVQQVPSFACDEATLVAQRDLLERESPGWGGEASLGVWRGAQQELAELGLPLSFFTYHRASDGTSCVAFWYPRLVPANGVLAMFKLLVRDVSWV